MGSLTCDYCDRGLDAGTLYRVNPVGVLPAVWAHEECHPRPGTRDPEVVTIARRDLTDLMAGIFRREPDGR